MRKNQSRGNPAVKEFFARSEAALEANSSIFASGGSVAFVTLADIYRKNEKEDLTPREIEALRKQIQVY